MASTLLVLAGFPSPSAATTSSSSSSPLRFSTSGAPAFVSPPVPLLPVSPLRPRSLSCSLQRNLKLMAASHQRSQPEEKDEDMAESVSVSMESRCFDIDGSQKILGFVETASRIIPVDKLLKSTIVPIWNNRLCYLKQSMDPDSIIWRGLKFTLLIVLLTFQASHQAVAGTEFSPVKPIPFIEEFGDITTGFASAFLLIFFSELGDKTFFIAALLAARNSGAIVFLGTFGALAAMSVVSVFLGRTLHYVDGILPYRFGETDFPIDDFAAVCLLVYFGVTTLLEATSDDEEKSKEEQEAELAISEFSGDGAGIMAAASTAVSTFVLVFVAEWGDKSFFSTIALAAASSPLGVVAGALAGHALATLLAVLGGSLLGTFLSEKIIAYVGGVLFLVFATVTLIDIVS